MAITQDESGSAGLKISIQNISKLVAALFTLASLLGGAAWYLLLPRINQFIDERVVASQQKPPLSLASAGSKPPQLDVDIADLKLKLEGVSNEIIRISGEITKLRNQFLSLAGTMTEMQAAFGYSFRFKGSQILAQRWPPNRVYFYAKPDSAVAVDVYLASKKFPVALKVDGVVMHRVISDSQQGLQLTGGLVHNSLNEMKPAQTGNTPNAQSPSSSEEPRPENLHYIEFVPGKAGFLFGNDDDFDISGMVRVWRPMTTAKNDN